MCAILGVKGVLPDISIIEKARDTLSHRGPDDFGIYVDESRSIALAHRRLSILDLSKMGHQPFISNDGRYVLIHNGEIYNYLELRASIGDTYDFKSETDTEVIIAAYIKWGRSCVEHFNGMFAFALYDKKENTLFCARDRLGIKPFFYTHQHGSFCFASEIKGLLALGVAAEEDEPVINDYLRFGLYDHTEHTFFREILSLPAGHTIEIDDDGMRIHRYWSLEGAENKYANLSLEEAQREFTDLLADAIRLRFRSDVSVGVNLSSGLDSNGLFYFGSKITNSVLPTFSICFDSDEYNECKIIERIMTDEQKALWSRAFSKPADVLDGAEKMSLIQDQPFGGVPTIVYEQLHKKASEMGVTVLLEGQGLDELLAGYKYYTVEYDKDENRKDRVSIDTLTVSQDMTCNVNETLLSSDFIEEYRGGKIEFSRPFKSNLLNAQYRDLTYTKLPRVLRFNDHVSMAYGRELRVPYLDHRLVEFCFGLGAEHKIGNGVQKLLMRKTMSKYIPNIVNTRAKKAFGAVQSEWMRSHLREFVYAILESSSFKDRRYWDQKKLRESVERFFGGEGENSFYIWQFINLEIWLRQNIDSAR